MNDFLTMIELIRVYIKDDKSIKIKDRDVANALSLTVTNFATIKRRNTTPYKNLLEFCRREGYSSEKMFFKSYSEQ